MEVGDCVDAILFVENTNEQMNLYNLGSNDTCSVRNIAAIVIRETGCADATIEYTGGDRGWAGDIPNNKTITHLNFRFGDHIEEIANTQEF